MIHAALEQRLSMWAAYCLRHCFHVPEGLSLPKVNISGDSLIVLDALADKDMDNELKSLREELSLEQKECDKLQREFDAIRKQSIHYKHVESLNEALKQFDPTYLQDMFQAFPALSMIWSFFSCKTKLPQASTVYYVWLLPRR